MVIKIYTVNGVHMFPEESIQEILKVVADNFAASFRQEIDETESTPVLEDAPEDPEITIARLNSHILELEAELTERKLSVDHIIGVLRPLGSDAAIEWASDVLQTPGTPANPATALSPLPLPSFPGTIFQTGNLGIAAYSGNQGNH